MSKEQQPPKKIHQFLDKQVMNTVALLNQNTILGSTHILYNKAIVDAILNDLKNMHDTLVSLANPPPQKTPPKESKIAPVPVITK